MELDASASKPPQLTPQPTTPRSADAKKNIQVSSLQSEKLKVKKSLGYFSIFFVCFWKEYTIHK